jgi:hypothetical protein
MFLRSLLLVSTSLLGFTTTTFASDDILPGALGSLPGSGMGLPGEDTALAKCTDETNVLLYTNAIDKQVRKSDILFQQASYEDMCSGATEGSIQTICEIDWSYFPSKLEQVCKSKGGRYIESSHDIFCKAADESNRQIILGVKNFPDCFGFDCAPADIERLLPDVMLSLETRFKVDFNNFNCTTNTVVEDEGFDFCPIHINAFPANCYEHMSQVGDVCECYSFCNGEMIGCTDYLNREPVTCIGELVQGCTKKLYNEFLTGSGVSIASMVVPGLLAMGAILLLL